MGMPRSTGLAATAALAGALWVVVLTGGGFAARVDAAGADEAGQSAGPREWLIFVDDLQTPFVETGRVREALRTIATTLVQNRDVATLRTVQSLGSSDPHVDGGALRASIDRISGTGPSVEAVSQALWQPRPNEVSQRATRSLAVALDVVETVWQPDTTRRAMIFMSGGYSDVDEVSAAIDAVATRARSHRVTIFTLDTRTLSRPPSPEPSIGPPQWKEYWWITRESLRRLAEATGGFMRDEQVDLPEALSSIGAIMR